MRLQNYPRTERIKREEWNKTDTKQLGLWHLRKYIRLNFYLDIFTIHHICFLLQQTKQAKMWWNKTIFLSLQNYYLKNRMLLTALCWKSSDGLTLLCKHNLANVKACIIYF